MADDKTTVEETTEATPEEPEFDFDAAKQRVADKVLAGKPLTNEDSLLAQGLVEVYDPSVGANRQVRVEDAKRMIESNKKLEKGLKGL